MKSFFIPNYIINKLPEKEDNKTADQNFRKQRNFFLDHPSNREVILAYMRKKVIHKETRRLFDSHNYYNITETPITIDEQIHSTKPSLNEALQLANIAYDFYHDKFQQESFDNRSSPIDLHIHYGESYNNAFYDGLRFVFGDGDQEYFKTFLLQDIFMHELTHAVTDHKVRGLPYSNQQGALNEHLSDVFAMCLKQRLNREKASVASWIVGEGVFTNKVNGKGIRTFKNEPAYNDNVLGLDEQPKHIKDYQDLPDTEEGDYGGVHINCGILNRAFYELCISVELEVSDEWNNRSWKSPLSVWYDSYPYIKATTNFEQFARITLVVARDNHPEIQTQVLKAWQTVGLKV